MRVLPGIASVMSASMLAAAAFAEKPNQTPNAATLSPEAASIITKPVFPQQGQQQGGQQQGPGNQTPNIIPQPPQQPTPTPVTPPAEALARPDLPDVDRAVDAARGADAAREAAAIVEQLDALRPDDMGLDLDQLDADRAREDQGLDPDQLGLLPQDPDVLDAAAALRAVTEQLGSNRDRQSDQTRGYGAGIVTDPSALLNHAGSGLAGDSVSTAGSGDDHVKWVDHDDGSRTVTERHESSDGREQNIQTHFGADGVIKSQTIVDRAPDGSVTTSTTERQPDGSYWNTMQSRNRDGSGRQTEAWRGPAPHVNVDPDSPYGKGGGQVVGPGQKAKDPKMVEAREGVGPGARPDENAGGAVTPRLDVEVDLTGQPDPGAQTGGSGSGYQGYNPDDFVRPPPPSL